MLRKFIQNVPTIFLEMESLDQIGIHKIKELYIDQKMSVEQVSIHLRNAFPSLTGLSATNVKDYLAEHNVRKRGCVNNVQLDGIMTQAIRSVRSLDFKYNKYLHFGIIPILGRWNVRTQDDERLLRHARYTVL